jgi:hypothetical protein
VFRGGISASPGPPLRRYHPLLVGAPYRSMSYTGVKHRVLPGRVMNLASNALLAKGVQSFLSPSRIAQALDRGGSTLRSLKVIARVRRRVYFPLPVVETSAIATGPIHQLRSELSAQSLRHLRRKTTALFLFRTPGKPRPVRKKTWAAAPAPTSPACQNALRTKKPLRPPPDPKSPALGASKRD